MKFGTVIADPPWPYEQATRHEKLSGYSNYEYEPLSVQDIMNLPVQDVSAPGAVLLLWSTGPFVVSGDATRVMRAWGFEPKSMFPWVKCDEIVAGTEPAFKPAYGVGYWVRGCAEYVMVGLAKGGKSHRSAYVGLLSDAARHSRKPDTLYELAETYPGPRLELFARRPREGWTTLGDELEGNEDIRVALPRLALQEAPEGVLTAPSEAL